MTTIQQATANTLLAQARSRELDADGAHSADVLRQTADYVLGLPDLNPMLVVLAELAWSEGDDSLTLDKHGRHIVRSAGNVLRQFVEAVDGEEPVETPSQLLSILMTAVVVDSTEDDVGSVIQMGRRLAQAGEARLSVLPNGQWAAALRFANGDTVTITGADRGEVVAVLREELAQRDVDSQTVEQFARFLEDVEPDDFQT